MKRSLSIIVSLIFVVSFVSGETLVSIMETSVENGSATARVPVNLVNSDAVGGLQFSVMNLPGEVNAVSVVPAGRADAESYTDSDGNHSWTPGEPLEDMNGNGVWDDAFTIKYEYSESIVKVLIFDIEGNSIVPGNGPICELIYSIPLGAVDKKIDLKFQETTAPDFLLAVSDPVGALVNTNWENSALTVGGVEVSFASGGGGSPGYLSLPIVVEMNNAEPVKGIQFNLVDSLDFLSIESVTGVGRAADFTFVGNEVDGQSMVLGIDFSGQEISAGTGAIAEIIVMISADAPMAGIPISISELIVAAEGGLPLPSSGDSGVFSVTVAVDDNTALPTVFDLAQNFPNPFNPTTTIEYSVPVVSEIYIGIYNLLGQEIQTLVFGEHQPGFYTANWNGLNKNGTRVESGMYLYRISSSTGYSATKKLVLLK